jgi:hypothetical protein
MTNARPRGLWIWYSTFEHYPEKNIVLISASLSQSKCSPKRNENVGEKQ